MARYLFYSHDSFGLGHLRRTLALTASVTARDPESMCLVVTGSTVATSYRLPDRVDTVKLPAITKDDDGHYGALRLPMRFSQVRAIRASLARAAAATFAPDVAVVDKAPFGARRELVAMLEMLKARGDCRLVLGLREIEDSPDVVRKEWGGGRLREQIERYYDCVFVYGPQGRAAALQHGDARRLSVPVIHVGYVAGPPAAQPPPDLRPGYLLVTVGGGADGLTVLTTFLEAVRVDPLDREAVIVTGPLLRDTDLRRVIDLAAGLPVRVEEFRPDMESVIAGASAVVAMAGYNTVTELLAARKRMLLVPRVRPREEQLLRARELATAGLAQMVHPDELTPSRMRDALRRVLSRPEPDVGAVDSDGAARAATILVDLAHRTPAARFRPRTEIPRIALPGGRVTVR
jgi:predicted glycosyltransferase